MMDKIKKWLIIGGCILLLVISFVLGRKSIRLPEPKVVRDTVVVTKWDTLRIDRPIPIKEVVTNEKIVYVDVEKHDTLYLPREERVYEQDSLYKCQVSGVSPQLDWIEVYPKTSYIKVTETVTQVIDRKVTCGLQFGFGIQYGLLNKSFDVGPSAQFGVNIRF